MIPKLWIVEKLLTFPRWKPRSRPDTFVFLGFYHRISEGYDSKTKQLFGPEMEREKTFRFQNQQMTKINRCVSKCGKPTSPKNHHEGYSIDVYCYTICCIYKIDGSKTSGMQSRSQGNREQLPASNMRWHPQTHMFLLRAPNCHIWIADKIICSFSCHPQMRIVPYRLWGFLRSQTLRQLMQNRGIGTGSSPIGNEGFAHPSARQRRRKTELVLQ